MLLNLIPKFLNSFDKWFYSDLIRPKFKIVILSMSVIYFILLIVMLVKEIKDRWF